MKKILFFLAATALLFSSCGEFGKTRLVGSKGSAFEIILTASPAIWDSQLGDTLRSILREPVEMINQREPIFDLYYIKPSGFTGVVPQNQNIIKVAVNEEHSEPRILAQYDVYAQPQIVVTICGNTIKSVTEYVSEHRLFLVDLLNEAQSIRYVNNISKYNAKEIEKLISKKFDFNMNLPKGYTVRKDAKEFLWLSFEYPLASQGIAIYSYPYTGKDSFTNEALLKARNKFTAAIPGPSDGSFMTTSAEIEPCTDYLRIYGRSWARQRGFWDVKGDFMGGPYVSFSTIDTVSNRVIALDCYVYSPKQPKRNYLRELEALLYTVKFPSDQTTER